MIAILPRINCHVMHPVRINIFISLKSSFSPRKSKISHKFLCLPAGGKREKTDKGF